MKSAALMLLAVLLLFLSPALALEPVVVVEEDSAVPVPKRLTTLVEEDSVPRISQAPLRFVQEESDAPAQAEPEPEQQPPEADQQAPEEQAQPEPEPPPAQEEQPEEPAQQPEPPPPPVPMPQAPEMPMLRPSNPGTQQASATPVRIVATAPAPTAPAAPTQQAFTTLAEEEPAEQAQPRPEPPPAQGNQQGDSSYVSEIASDFRYTINNAEADVEDVVTAPLHLDQAGSLVVEPKFYYTLLGAGAALGGAFALDQTVRAHLRHMGSGTADGFETGGNFFMYGSSGLLYLWGLQSADSNLREHEITGFEASGIASLITIGLKDGFGRLRPYQGHGHFAFFDQGESFVSGAATPVYALAAATSEAYDNAWYVAIPAYLGATAVGVGRMGNDAHWVSDIVGSALVGIGTTELLLYLHREHAADPSRFRIFPVSAPNPGAVARQGGAQGLAPQGLGVSYEW